MVNRMKSKYTGDFGHDCIVFHFRQLHFGNSKSDIH